MNVVNVERLSGKESGAPFDIEVRTEVRGRDIVLTAKIIPNERTRFVMGLPKVISLKGGAS